jgi:hypothetical protein
VALGADKGGIMVGRPLAVSENACWVMGMVALVFVVVLLVVRAKRANRT